MEEIERKFVLAAVPGAAAGTPGEAIAQGYLAVGGDLEVRLRARAGRYVQTVKAGSGLVRREIEVELTREQFEALWPATEGRRVEKTRYLVEAAGHTVEIDVFHGALTGLITAEVEFGSEEEAAVFEPPGWLGEEVTGDPRYANRNLALVEAPPDP